MLKTALVFALGTLGGVAALSSSPLLYSAIQFDFPAGAALKVTPNPGNIWAWHLTDQPYSTQTGTAIHPIVVDFDGNGVPDTQSSNIRILITDIQFVGDYVGNQWFGSGRIALWSNGREIWRITPTERDSSSGSPHTYHYTFATPLALSVGADLELRYLSTSNGPFSAHVLGRLGTL